MVNIAFNSNVGYLSCRCVFTLLVSIFTMVVLMSVSSLTVDRNLIDPPEYEDEDY